MPEAGHRWANSFDHSAPLQEDGRSPFGEVAEWKKHELLHVSSGPPPGGRADAEYARPGARWTKGTFDHSVVQSHATGEVAEWSKAAPC